ncbi:cytochrome P450 [Talaromyces proteolyticus]|uniref:Cytochrome P450 n=1 Tax=Talaromyces proteolyticus TaxID=1131652 RepID=A0AAD4Q0G2_9EURO|nr:cytochrome P450 [Talaromyces proteolyticus]KAH8704058.1 cytochrome P450 [Talaromyces proteolyticus]
MSTSIGDIVGSLSPAVVAYAVFAITIVHYAWTVTYRLYFHPLTRIPGPLFARITYLYSFYYNFWNPGRFYMTIEELHKQYGPIVRVTPDEIHLRDPENYDKIYYIGSKYYKSPAFYHAFGTDKATFTTASNEVHRAKRAALNPFFSRKRVLELEEVVQAKAIKLESRIRSALNGEGHIDLHHGFRAVSVDVITDYAFNNCYDFLERADFGVEFFNMIRDFGPGFWFFQQFPATQPIAFGLPFWLVKMVDGPLKRMMMLQNSSREQILRVKREVDSGEESSKTRPTIFHRLLSPDAADEYIVPTVDELKDEAYIIVAAAADTTGNAMTVATYNVVLNQDIYIQLTTELKNAFPDPSANLDFATLEKLPYLTAVIKEALRLSYGVIGRLPRVVPESGAEFHGYHVPPGTLVSMSSWTMHRNEDLFPGPEEFKPSRWMDPSAAIKNLDHYLVSFGKGSRQCVGMPLAYCELYVTLGRIFRHFDNLSTDHKSVEDLLYSDYFSSYHSEKGNKFDFRQAV